MLALLAGMGAKTASADDIAAGAVSSPEVARQVEAALGVSPLDREGLRALVLADPTARRRLNAIVHPAVARAVLTCGADVVEVPLLIETCLHPAFDRVWVVTCGPEEQLRRLTARLGSEDAARRLVASQLPTRVKCAFADAIVRTNRPMDDVIESVAAEAARQGLT